MEHLKRLLKISDEEYKNSLHLDHSEFVLKFKQGQIDYQLPKRYINLFYNLYIEKWRQIIVQILLSVVWGCYIFGIYLFFQNEFFQSMVYIAGAWTTKQWTNYFALLSIKKGLLEDPKYYYDLLKHGIIRVYYLAS